MKIFSTLAKPGVVLGASVVGAALLRRRPDDAARLLMSAPAALLLSDIVKHALSEHRPRLFDTHPEQSFPSGHSAGMAAFAIALASAVRSLPVTLAAVSVVAATDYCRVQEREHWPRDVLVGDLIGIAGSLLGALGARWVRARPRIRNTRIIVASSFGSASNFPNDAPV